MSIGLDIFKQDAFSTFSLTNGILKLPFKPSRIGELGLFVEKGIVTTKVAVEEKAGRLSLIQTGPRGGPGDALGQMKRTARAFVVPHLERETKILADEIQNVRAWGPVGDPQTATLAAVSDLVNERLVDLRRAHELTLERLRLGAITGSVKDADGTELLNLFTAFEVSQSTYAINDTVDIRKQAVQIIRKIEYTLGGTPVSGFRALCGDYFFDALLAAIKTQAVGFFATGGFDPTFIKGDIRKGFEWGGIVWENYRSRLVAGSTPYLADAEAYVVPENADIFYTYFAPADFVETVNTTGQPIYAKQSVDPDFQRYVLLHTQSNPLCLCLRPDAVVKLTYTT